MDAVRTFLEGLGLWTVMLLTVIKVVTSIIVAVQNNVFKANQLGTAFRDDFLKLAAVVVLVVVAPDQQFGGISVSDGIVAAFVAWESARIAANLAGIFPFMGSIVPAPIQATAKPRVMVEAEAVPVVSVVNVAETADLVPGDVVQVKDVTEV